MACEFPIGPTLNQIHSCTGGFNYYWDGYGWQFLPGASLGFYAITSQNNLFTGLNRFSSGISAGGGMTLAGTVSLNGQTFTNVVSSVNDLTGPIGISAGSNISITLAGKTLTISVTGGGLGATGATGATGSQGNTGATGPVGDYVISFNGSTGAVTGITVGGTNIFTALNAFNAGISAAGGTFSALTRFTAGISAGGGITFANDISVNGVRTGRGGGNQSTNTAVGASALVSNTSGNNNSAVGVDALANNTSGNNNSAVGGGALNYNTTGSSNVAIGWGAGIFYSDDQELFDPENSIYIGAGAMGFSNSDNNTIVIGSSAIADGANTTVIGNSSTTSTRVFGTLSTNGGISAAGGTFSALTVFTAGISAGGGMTLAGSFQGSTATFSGLGSFSAGFSAAGGATFGGTVASDTGYRITANAINAQTGTTYTFLSTDNGKIVSFNNDSAVTVTIPTSLPVGFNCTAIQLGAGQVGFTAASGVTMNAYASAFKISGQHGAATVVSYTTNIFNVSGTLSV